jgi:hypothetical protein
MRKGISSFSKLGLTALIASLIAAPLLSGVGPFGVMVQADRLTHRSLQLDNNRPGELATYIVSMDIATAGTLGSIRIDFCHNSSLLDQPCTAPPGFDITGATLADQSGATGFMIYPATTANVLLLSRIPASVVPTTVTFTLQNVHNSSDTGSSYARYRTFASNDGSGSETDTGAVAYSLSGPVGVTAEVPPYLTACVAVTITDLDCSTATGNFVQMGNFSTNTASTGQTQVVVATNAENGYTVRIRGLTMSSGNNSIPPLPAPTASTPGVSQFGINLRANTSPGSGQEPTGPGSGVVSANYNLPNFYQYVSDDIIAGSQSAQDYQKFTATYLVNISRSQPAGVYSSTFAYVALGNF